MLAVLGSHTAQYWTTSLGAVSVYQLGHMGVLLFFVHTALVLMGSLERGELAGLRNGRLAVDFYVRRLFRIYPLAIVAILLVVALGLPRMPDEPAVYPMTARVLLGNLTLSQNLFAGIPTVSGPLWSLPLEVQMYVLLPLCYWAVRRGGRSASYWLAGLAMIAGVVQTLAMDAQAQGVWRLSVLSYAPCFVAGVWAYARTRSPSRVVSSRLWLPLLLALLAFYPALFPTLQQSAWRGWPLAFAVGAMIPMVRELPESRLTGLAKWIATYSYGIYLFHIPMFVMIVGPYATPPRPWRGLVGIAATLAVSVLLYHTVERPLISRGAKLAARLRASPGVSIRDRAGAGVT